MSMSIQPSSGDSKNSWGQWCFSSFKKFSLVVLAAFFGLKAAAVVATGVGAYAVYSLFGRVHRKSQESQDPFDTTKAVQEGVANIFGFRQADGTVPTIITTVATVDSEEDKNEDVSLTSSDDENDIYSVYLETALAEQPPEEVLNELEDDNGEVSEDEGTEPVNEPAINLMEWAAAEWMNSSDDHSDNT